MVVVLVDIRLNQTLDLEVVEVVHHTLVILRYPQVQLKLQTLLQKVEVLQILYILRQEV